MAALVDAVHVLVAETSVRPGGMVGLKLHVLTAETPTRKNPHPVSQQMFPGFISLGQTVIEVDAATAAGIERGHKFTLTPKLETP